MSQNGYSNPLVFKAGGSFDYTGDVVIRENGVPVTNLADWVGHCQLKTTAGSLIAALTVQWVDASQGLIRVYAPNSTNAWPQGLAVFDLVLVSPLGERVATETVYVQIVAGVTSVPA